MPAWGPRRNHGFIVSLQLNSCGCLSKPCTPGEHQNRWQMHVHPPQNGAIGYAPWPCEDLDQFLPCPWPLAFLPVQAPGHLVQDLAAALPLLNAAGQARVVPHNPHMAVGQNQCYHVGVGAPPILVYFSGDWNVHWGTGFLTHGHMTARKRFRGPQPRITEKCYSPLLEPKIAGRNRRNEMRTYFHPWSPPDPRLA